MSSTTASPPLLTAAGITGPVRLLAGPGAGKTHALVELYADLVRSGHAGRGEILVLTFSSSAADELERRIDDRLGDSYDQAWISTFHSFCARLLRDNRPDPRRILLSAFQEWVVMRQVLMEVDPDAVGELAPVRHSDAFARDALALFALLKQNLVYPATLSMAAETSGTDRVRRLAALYSAYQDRLEGAAMLDFRDLVTATIAMLEARPALLEGLRARFRYVLVDEFQDVDPAQFHVLRLIASPSDRPRLVVVGDPDQSVYGFRGTQPRLLEEEFPRIYPGCQTVRLDRSRRCPPAVLGAARRLIDAQAPPLAGAAPITVAGEASAEDEAFYVAREIRRLILESGGALRARDFAILLRSTVTLAAPFEEALRALQLEHEVRGTGAAGRNEVLRFLLAYMRTLAAADGRTADEALERLLASGLSGADLRAVGRVRAYAREHARPFARSLRQLMHHLAERDPENFPLPWPASAPPSPPPAPPEDGEEDGPNGGRPRPPDYFDLLTEPECRTLHAALQTHQRLRRRAGSLSLSALAYSVLMEAGVLERVLGAGLEEADQQAAITALRAALDAFAELEVAWARLNGRAPRLGDVGPDLDRMLSAAVDEAAPADRRSDAVQIMTVHQAKGLEFEVVFMSGLSGGVFPPAPREHPLLDEGERAWMQKALAGFQPSWPASPAAHLAEEARLAFVGMTRPRRHLYLTFAHAYERPAGPSTFIDVAAEGLPRLDRTRGTQRLEASNFVTLGEAETLLAQCRDLVDATAAAKFRRLGVDVDFVLDPSSGRPFWPHEGPAPSGVDPHHFSATDLTAYIKCPRLYWYNHHPGLVAPERGPALERGSFLHEVLEEYHRREQEWLYLDEPARREWLEAEFQPRLQAHLDHIEGELERRREEMEVRAILDNYIRFVTGSMQTVRRLRTLKVEQRFVLQVEGAEIHGKIDRINDTGEGTHEVLDYKTGGASRLSESYEAYFGPDMYDVQLALYQLACREGVDEEGRPLRLNPRFLSLWYPKEWFRNSIRQVLFSIGNPFPPLKWVEQPLTGEELGRSRAVVVDAIRRIRSGDFAPRPREVVGTCVHRTGCPHSMICPYGGSVQE